MIADDEHHVRELLAGLVRTLGGEVVGKAADGGQAVALFRQLHPDMVVLDMNMPVMRGDEVVRRMRIIDSRAVIVMMSADDSLDTVRRCLELGAHHYILKSAPAEKLYDLLEDLWRGVVAGLDEAAA